MCLEKRKAYAFLLKNACLSSPTITPICKNCILVSSRLPKVQSMLCIFFNMAMTVPFSIGDKLTVRRVIKSSCVIFVMVFEAMIVMRIKEKNVFIITERGKVYLEEYKKWNDISQSFGLDL